MRRRLLCRGMILIVVVMATLVVDRYFGLLDGGPRFRLKSASAWSAAISRGETIFGYPEDEQRMPVTRYMSDEGTASLYFRRLWYHIFPDHPCGRALKQCSCGPDSM